MQVYHYCHFDGRQDSFLCPRGTVFNQAVFVCDWWYNVDCSSAQSFYQLNQNLYRVYFKSCSFHKSDPRRIFILANGPSNSH